MEFLCVMNLLLNYRCFINKYQTLFKKIQVQFERNIELVGKVSTPKDKPNQEQKRTSDGIIFCIMLLSAWGRRGRGCHHGGSSQSPYQKNPSISNLLN